MEKSISKKRKKTIRFADLLTKRRCNAFMDNGGFEGLMVYGIDYANFLKNWI